jgi:hypothetical protein
MDCAEIMTGINYILTIKPLRVCMVFIVSPDKRIVTIF